MLRSALFVLAIAVAPQLFAQATYTYTGPTFDNTAQPPYTSSQNITGSFTVAQPLTPGLVNVDISSSLTALSFTDGQATRTLADSVLCSFRVTTDRAGLITGHEIWLRQSNTTPSQNQHNIEIYDPSKGTSDLAGFGAQGGTDCAPGPLSPFANSTAGTGTWAAASVGVQRSIPVNANWAIALMAGMLLLLGYRRLQA